MPIHNLDNLNGKANSKTSGNGKSSFAGPGRKMGTGEVIKGKLANKKDPNDDDGFDPMAEQPDDSDDMAYEVEGNELAADMIEIEDRWGNITQVPRGKEDRITKRQVADKVLATDSFKDNTSRAAARFFMVIKRAAEVKIGDAVEISACQTANMPIANSDMFPCKNGRYINHDPKRPSRVRVMSDEEMEQLGVKHPCDCPQCKKHNDFNFDIEDIDAIEYKKTRSGRGFKLPTDYVLGE